MQSRTPQKEDEEWHLALLRDTAQHIRDEGVELSVDEDEIDDEGGPKSSSGSLDRAANVTSATELSKGDALVPDAGGQVLWSRFHLRDQCLNSTLLLDAFGAF